ncbi:MAG: hypothetical protein ABI472_24600 [Ginsengibacter sp.]
MNIKNSKNGKDIPGENFESKVKINISSKIIAGEALKLLATNPEFLENTN